jgi:hypothetical protein
VRRKGETASCAMLHVLERTKETPNRDNVGLVQFAIDKKRERHYDE